MPQLSGLFRVVKVGPRKEALGEEGFYCLFVVLSELQGQSKFTALRKEETMKRLHVKVILLVAGMALFASAAFAQSTMGALKFPSGKTYKIGFASREIVNDADRDIIAGAKKVIEAAGGTMVVTDGQTDPRKHNENIENLINSGVDGIIIALGDPQQLAPVVAKANARHIPVVTTTVGSTTPGALTDVGGDDAMMGVMMTRALFSAIGYKGDVYVFWVPGAPVLEIRKAMLEAMAKSYPQIVLHEVPTEHGPAKGQAQMMDILTAHPQKGSIAGVWGAYDLLVSGPVESIRRAGRSEIKAASIDGDVIGFQMLYEDRSPFVATVAQDIPHIGELAATDIVRALNGQAASIPIREFTNFFTATRSNGVKAIETRFGPNAWATLKLDKAQIMARFPQTQDVGMVSSVVP
jgi:ABC-type sugar transport system substrate-binding protein